MAYGIERGVAMNDDDIKKVFEKLGGLEAKLDAISKTQDKMFYGLLGVIAAQIGVKMLSTDPFLYIATALAALGLAFTAGVVIGAIRNVRHFKNLRLTTTGLLCLIFLIGVALVQIGVFMRDVGGNFVSPRVVYILRIAMNTAWVLFILWLWKETRIFRKR